MKKLISIISAITALFFYSSAVRSLHELAHSKVIESILDYPTLTSEQKGIFNHSAQFTGKVLNLTKVNFDYLVLKEINIYGADFQGVHFKGTNFYRADLKGCNFKGATFENVNLREANLTGIDFQGCNFKGAELRGAILTDTFRIPCYSKTSEILECYSNLTHEEDKKVLNKLIGTGTFDFRSQIIENLNLQRINLKNCNLSGITLKNCDLTGVQLENTVLGQFIFSNIILSKDFIISEDSTPDSLIMAYAHNKTSQQHKELLNSILGSGIDIKYHRFNNLNLNGINLTGARFISSDSQPISFRDSKLVNSQFTNTKFIYLRDEDPSFIDLRNVFGADYSKVDNSKYIYFQGAVFIEGSKIPNYISHKDLIKQCIQSKNPLEKENIYKLLDFFPLDLQDEDLTNYNLIGFPLHKFNLKGAQLSGAKLFKGVTGPRYTKIENLLADYSNYPGERENLNKFFDLQPTLIDSTCLKGLNLEGIHIIKDFLSPAYKNHFNSREVTSAKLLLGSRTSQHVTLFSCDTQIKYEKKITQLIEDYSKFQDLEERQKLNNFFKLLKINIYEDQPYKKVKYTALKKANLSDINLAFAKIKGGDYQGTSFKNADLSGSVFVGSDLREADFTGAHLKRNKFINCHLQGSIFFNGFKVPNYQEDKDLLIFYSEHTDPKIRRYLNMFFELIELNLCDKIINGLNLEEINLAKANLSRACFQRTKLKDANLNPNTLLYPYLDSFSKNF